MRKLSDIDDEIHRAEQRLAILRDDLNVNLQASRLRARRTLSSPRVLFGAVAAGFLLDRMSRRKRHRGPERRGRSSGMSGIIAGVAAAALRAAISNPSMWRDVKQWWSARNEAAHRAVQRSAPAAAGGAEVMPFRASNVR